MRASTANPPEATQARKSRDYLSKLFAHRLSLTQVAQSMIQAWIGEWFTESRLQASNSWIGVIQPGGRYTQLITLSDALIKRCMSGEALNYTPGHHQLLIRLGEEVFQPVTQAINVDDIELMLNTLAPGVLVGFGQRLVDYWNARVPHDPARSRWNAVGSQLRACLLTARQNPPLLPEHAQSLLGLGVEETVLWGYRADREVVGSPDALHIYQVYAVQAERAGEWLPLLVLQRRVQGQQISLVYVPAMNLLKLDTLDALGNLLPRYMNHYRPGVPINWVLREPDGNVFDALAQTLLERQLRNVYRLDWSALPYISSYEQLFIKLTSPLAWFDPDYLQQPHEEQLPVWLQLANRADRQVYGQWLERLEHLQRATGGASFLEGLDPIDVYARKALQRQMRLDYPTQAPINPDDYLLTFERTQGATVGWTQRTSRTLTQWSLENPFATAYARVQISNQAMPGQVPGRITPAYLKHLIESVDVGKHYPALLEHALIADPAESARRRRLFVDQMAIQLPMLAFEHSLRQRYGFTRAGALVVQAMLQGDPQKRVIDGEVIVARPLAFLVHAGGRAHQTDNLYVIGPRDNGQLPHILYRPDHTEAVLQQFASRQALLDEIARVGSDLQCLVLQRLPDDSRAMFGNGGFLNPHVQRFLQGDEYDALPGSSPALLSDALVQGDFLTTVFNENAKSLWQLAMKQSASNEALRWTVFKNDLWQLFNALLPMIRGPVAVAGWLFQTFRTFRTVLALPAQASREETANALAELMGSVAGLLMSPVVTLDQRLRLDAIKTVTTGAAQGSEVIPVSHTLEPVWKFAWQRSHADITAMDYAWANSRLKLDTAQRAQLETFQWSPGPGETWPANPSVISTDSPVRGRVRVQGRHQDYTLIDSKLYGVKPDGDRWRIADLRNNQRLGPWLRQDSKGIWKIDLGLRLLGGQPKKTTAAERRLHLQNENRRLEGDYDRASARLAEVLSRVAQAQKRYKEAHAAGATTFTDHQRRDISTEYLIELENEYRLQCDRINALNALNTHKPVSAFEREKMKQLEAMIENLRDQMTVVINVRADAILPDERLIELDAQMDGADEVIAQAAHRTFAQSSRTIAGYNVQLIELSTLEQNARERLMGVPGFEPYAHLKAPSDMGTPLDWQSMQLKALYGAVLRRLPSSEESAPFEQVHGLLGEAIQSIQSQKTLQEPGLLSMQQRINGYEAIAREYRRSQAGVREYGDMAADVVDERVIEQLSRLLEELGQQAAQSLSGLLREQEEHCAPQPVSVLSADKRLFRDRKNRYQLGKVRARTPESDDEIVDILNPIDKRVQTSFRRSPSSNDFEPVIEATAPVPRPTRSLENLKGDARRLLDRESIVLQQARAEALGSSLPDSVETRLIRQSTTIQAVAEKIRKALPSTPDTASQALLDELEQAARRYLEAGRRMRIDMIKRLPPDEDGIAWLQAQDQVQILRIEGRIALKRVDDFLQEYVVKDKQGKVLAYAHFHYSTPTAPDTAYNAGHLKRPEQRFMSFRSLADKTDRDVIEIYYSRISAPKAAQLFFNTTGSVKHRGRRSFW